MRDGVDEAAAAHGKRLGLEPYKMQHNKHGSGLAITYCYLVCMFG
jgi:hypothetical protein